MNPRVGEVLSVVRRTISIAIASALVGTAHCQENPNEEIPEYVRSALHKEGDIERGKSLFASDRLACAKCHSLDGTRSKAAPDLSAVGEKFGRREIIESVLTPSARISEGYETTLLMLNEGKTVSGIIKSATDQSLELLTQNGELIHVDPDEIESRRTSATSIMPQGIHAVLSKGEFNDLIEFLVSLKQVDTASRIIQGMPSVIDELTSPVELRPIIGHSLKFDQPVWLGSFPDFSDRFLVIEHQVRRIWMLKAKDESTAEEGDRKKLFLDLGPTAANEGRLAALAFHPSFVFNQKYYLLERVTLDGKMFVTVIEREVSEDGQRDSGREPRLILQVPQTTGAHFGGWLEFGPDGFLYISFGDSGPQEDPNGNAQHRNILLGKIARIDVDRQESEKPYSIPKDNPFVSDPGTLPEIWALGFRAPWRLSFDRVTGDLWVGDVGQDRYEKVAIVRRGENHGWNVYEGFEAFSNRYRREKESYTSPIFAYGRKYGPSVTGGFVYRADPRSTFYGKYIFGDYESRRIFALSQQDRTLKEIRQIGTAPQRIVSFGQDAEGEIYVVGYEGILYRIDFSTAKFE